jgi:transcriptional regulator with XRE-family HTH domain
MSTAWLRTQQRKSGTLPDMPPADTLTYLARILRARGMRQVDLARGLGTHRQQISKWVSEGRPISPVWAKRMEPLVGVPWPDLVEGKFPQELAAGIEQGVVVGQGGPHPGDPIYDADELALLRMWRQLSLTKRAALFAYLGADDLPSLRKTI